MFNKIFDFSKAVRQAVLRGIRKQTPTLPQIEHKFKVDTTEVQAAIDKSNEIIAVLKQLNSEVEELSRQVAHMTVDLEVV